MIENVSTREADVDECRTGTFRWTCRPITDFARASGRALGHSLSNVLEHWATGGIRPSEMGFPCDTFMVVLSTRRRGGILEWIMEQRSELYQT